MIPGLMQGIGQGLNAMFGWIGERREAKRNLNQWHRENAYNHPSAQMARLQEAGLNPALMYGGSPGQATGNAGSIQSTKAAGTNFDFDAMSNQLKYANVKQSKAATDNLRLQSEVIAADADLKKAQTQETFARTGATMESTNLTRQQILTQELGRAQTRLQMAKTSAEKQKIGYEIKAIEATIRQTNQNIQQSATMFPWSLDMAKENLRLREQETIGKGLSNQYNAATLENRIEQTKVLLSKAMSETNTAAFNSMIQQARAEMASFGIQDSHPIMKTLAGLIYNARQAFNNRKK